MEKKRKYRKPAGTRSCWLAALSSEHYPLNILFLTLPLLAPAAYCIKIIDDTNYRTAYVSGMREAVSVCKSVLSAPWLTRSILLAHYSSTWTAMSVSLLVILINLLDSLR